MKTISIADDIVPVGDFKAQISRLLKHVGERAGPVVITQNGRAAGVLLSPVEYDRLNDRERFVESILAGAADADSGRTMDTDTLRARLTERRAERQIERDGG